MKLVLLLITLIDYLNAGKNSETTQLKKTVRDRKKLNGICGKKESQVFCLKKKKNTIKPIINQGRKYSKSKSGGAVKAVCKINVKPRNPTLPTQNITSNTTYNNSDLDKDQFINAAHILTFDGNCSSSTDSDSSSSSELE
ncbi:hypothetical protein EDEG_01202 [Edhazardia aedis USNM 41457]|uniref:Uncharacterized protein n=1 Tax=Edhazardia aedis (strain USNM 41457) TaxID=1003232 RepID=J8ZY81_EDHAE|nr:hypothetical protein EDEG_01202 [Edhazardia aedis USNM 41457]|eukprot:EJW04588.1 hypothetical protein EDEG_01202 [Edhazardia aedis USNM 41457]